MSHEVESRRGADVPAVQVAGPLALPAGALRVAGAGAGDHHAPRTRFPGPAVGRSRPAPRAIHQPTQWSRIVKV